MEQTENWIVVADEAIARVLRWPASGGLPEPVVEWTDPDAHARGRDLARDATGRRAAGGRSAAGATTSAGPDERHQEAGDFARRVAGELTQAHRQHRFGRLQIAAAPRFLGLLRKSLDAQVAACVADSIDKDLAQADPATLAGYFAPPGPR